MDLIVTIILLLCISSYKVVHSPVEVVTSTIVNEEGITEEININSNQLKVGKNLMLRREPRAYHKILDELGLS